MCNTVFRMYITCKNVTTMGTELFIMNFLVVSRADHQSVMPHPVSVWVVSHTDHLSVMPHPASAWVSNVTIN